MADALEQRLAERARAKLLAPGERNAALAYLRRDTLQNLLLIDHVATVGASSGDIPAQVVAVWRGGAVCGVAALRPSLVLDPELDESAIDTLLPYFETIAGGLVKSDWNVVTELWGRLEGRGRSALVDRAEVSCALGARTVDPVAVPEGGRLRRAREADLEQLVVTARASLREEDRPDPFDGDPAGFRRWVRGRMHRARVIELDGRVVFVGYADVRRPEGWLVQGVYTLPELRRRGFAAAGISAILREAFDSGATHVQLAVVEGNGPALRLYEGLGFRPFARLRTILFF